MGHHNIILDPAIRDWVVLPLVAMMILVGIGRHYVQQLMKSDAAVTEDNIAEMKRKQTVARSQKLQSGCHFLDEDSWKARRGYFNRKKPDDALSTRKEGVLREKDIPAAGNPIMSNPMAMVDMMKGQVTFMVTNMGMMTFCNWFFAGFVCVKFPFSMPSNGFKTMLQRGIDLKSLDITYVSSLSWYLLISFGLRGLYQLILGQDVDSEEQRMMQMQMGGMGGGGGGFDATAAFKQQRTMLTMIKQKSQIDEAEKSLLKGSYPNGQETAFESFDLNGF
jgi:ER membrane protein complex subunit 3